MIENMVIRIDNFDNDAMQESGPAVVSMLKNLIADIERRRLEELDGIHLMDSNGNRVGRVYVNLVDEDDIDDEDDDDEDFDDLDDE